LGKARDAGRIQVRRVLVRLALTFVLEGVKTLGACHPERSEGSPQFLWFND